MTPTQAKHLPGLLASFRFFSSIEPVGDQGNVIAGHQQLGPTSANNVLGTLTTGLWQTCPGLQAATGRQIPAGRKEQRDDGRTDEQRLRSIRSVNVLIQAPDTPSMISTRGGKAAGSAKSADRPPAISALPPLTGWRESVTSHKLIGNRTPVRSQDVHNPLDADPGMTIGDSKAAGVNVETILVLPAQEADARTRMGPRQHSALRQKRSVSIALHQSREAVGFQLGRDRAAAST